MWLAPLLVPLLAPSPAWGLLIRCGTSAACNSTHARSTDVYYIVDQLDQLRAAVANAHTISDQQHAREAQRLETEISNLVDNGGGDAGSPSRTALETAVQVVQQQRAAADAATLEMLEFYHTARAMLGGRGGAPACRFLACGPHADCVTAGGRARCECRPCFVGDGFSCRPGSCGPGADLAAKALLGESPPGYPTVPHITPVDVDEVQIAVLAQNHLAVVVKSASAVDQGAIVIGRVQANGTVWGPWQSIAPKAKVFGLSLTGLANGRLVISYRDAEKGGTGHFVGGQINETGRLKAILQPPQAFARGMDGAAALVSLASSRVACLYSGGGANGRLYGGVLLLQTAKGGALSIMGRYRFSEGSKLAQLTATALSPTSFVAGFRVVPDPQAPPGQGSRELSATWFGVQDSELIVGPPLTLEANKAGIRARALALVSKDTFAYSYESEFERQTKIAIVRVDPSTHKMKLVGGPDTIAKGKIAFLKSITLAGGPAAPKTFTYLQHPGRNSKGEVCSVASDGRILNCKSVAWADTELRAVGGARLPDGRMAFAFSNVAGEPFFRLLSSDESGTRDV